MAHTPPTRWTGWARWPTTTTWLGSSSRAVPGGESNLFEVIKSDLGGRVGRLHTNHGVVETPAYVPVVHPLKQTIPAADMGRMGFDMVITNAYITMKRYGASADIDIHDVIGFDGPVMTDSGGYQVLEYGDLDVSPAQMANFEVDIGTDVAVPLDKPTGYGHPHSVASDYVRRTLEACRQTLESVPHNGQIWAGPVQGGEHEDLVAGSATHLLKQGYPMLALGSPVEFMESYRYVHLTRMMAAAREAAPSAIPMHLFGAGHPLTIPLAVALGYDTFDSASYILYAKQGRYITSDGTRHLDEMRALPCVCPVCSSYTVSEISADDNRTDLLAVHNLWAIRQEVEITRQAIYEGRLWEHVCKKARAHPKLFEALPVMAGYDWLAAGTPRFKDRAAFFFDYMDQYRPEAAALRHMVRRFRTKKSILHVVPQPETRPAYLGRCAKLDPDGTVQVCVYTPCLGVIPLELSDLYPAAHHMDARMSKDPSLYPTFAESWEKFLGNNAFDEIRYNPHDRFLSHFVDHHTPGTLRRSMVPWRM